MIQERFAGIWFQSRDSSVGRASDWRSEGPRLDPGSQHSLNCGIHWAQTQTKLSTVEFTGPKPSFQLWNSLATNSQQTRKKNLQLKQLLEVSSLTPWAQGVKQLKAKGAKSTSYTLCIISGRSSCYYLHRKKASIEELAIWSKLHKNRSEPAADCCDRQESIIRWSVQRHRSHFGSRYKSGPCCKAGLLSFLCEIRSLVGFLLWLAKVCWKTI